MAKKEPTKPEEVKTDPATETPTEETKQPEQPLEAGGEHTPPEKTTVEPATQAQEAEAILSDKGEEQPAQDNPIDIGGEHRPGDDVVVSFDKINEIISEKKAAAKVQEAEQTAPEKKEPEAPAKKTGRDRTPKTDKPAKEAPPEKAPKAEKTAKAPKAAKKPAPAKEAAPPPPRKSRRNRGRPRDPAKKRKLYISNFPNCTRSKITRSKSARTRKWRQWWKASRTKA